MSESPAMGGAGGPKPEPEKAPEKALSEEEFVKQELSDLIAQNLEDALSEIDHEELTDKAKKLKKQLLHGPRDGIRHSKIFEVYRLTVFEPVYVYEEGQMCPICPSCFVRLNEIQPLTPPGWNAFWCDVVRPAADSKFRYLLPELFGKGDLEKKDFDKKNIMRCTHSIKEGCSMMFPVKDGIIQLPKTIENKMRASMGLPLLK